MILSLGIINHNNIQHKLEFIENKLVGKKIIVAFSGGVDSTCMAYLSKKYGEKVLLVMQTGISVSIEEQDEAQSIAEELKLPLKFIEYNEIELSLNYQNNDENRCYYCKTILYNKLNEVKEKYKFDLIVTGTNKSDLSGHRPGHRSSIENNINNPLVDAEITKEEVRWIVKDAGIKNWNKPATACLASRFVTGVKITEEQLARVDKAERIIKRDHKIKILRVRELGFNTARIEIGIDELDTFEPTAYFGITQALYKIGYKLIFLDQMGYRPIIPKINRNYKVQSD
ncbi:MAG: ATP-dependent sacrificial sulfur transferase LarE [Candidatus Heimdallarchaeota archaeon]|nr:ATP-dependent sacrificial sulfur transferase LarE [Candidatus Heimdallarchaeota archaeon]